MAQWALVELWTCSPGFLFAINKGRPPERRGAQAREAAFGPVPLPVGPIDSRERGALRVS